jgi:hypothetical protein
MGFITNALEQEAKQAVIAEIKQVEIMVSKKLTQILKD